MCVTNELSLVPLDNVISADSLTRDSSGTRKESSSSASEADLKGALTSSNVQLRLSHSRTLSAANSLNPEGRTVDPHDLYLGDIYADSDFFLTTEPEQK